MRPRFEQERLWKMAAERKGKSSTLSAYMWCWSAYDKAAMHILIDEVEQDRYNGIR